MNPESSSFLMRAWTMRGSAVADCKLLQIMLEFGMLSRPGSKPSFKPERRNWVNFLSGWFPSSLASDEIMIREERYFCSFLLELADERRTGQMDRAWAPPQKLQMWRKQQRCLMQPEELKLLHTCLPDAEVKIRSWSFLGRGVYEVDFAAWEVTRWVGCSGLVREQSEVVWTMDLQMAQERFRTPRKTWLYNSKSRAPQ